MRLSLTDSDDHVILNLLQPEPHPVKLLSLLVIGKQRHFGQFIVLIFQQLERLRKFLVIIMFLPLSFLQLLFGKT